MALPTLRARSEFVWFLERNRSMKNSVQTYLIEWQPMEARLRAGQGAPDHALQLNCQWLRLAGQPGARCPTVSLGSCQAQTGPDPSRGRDQCFSANLTNPLNTGEAPVKVQHEGDGNIFLRSEVKFPSSWSQISVWAPDRNSYRLEFKIQTRSAKLSEWSTRRAGNFSLSQPTSIWYIWLCLSEQMDHCRLERCNSAGWIAKFIVDLKGISSFLSNST